MRIPTHRHRRIDIWRVLQRRGNRENALLDRGAPGRGSGVLAAQPTEAHAVRVPDRALHDATGRGREPAEAPRVLGRRRAAPLEPALGPSYRSGEEEQLPPR